jgi:hypothetical protein
MLFSATPLGADQAARARILCRARPGDCRRANKAAREQAIKQLPQTNPALWQSFQAAKHAAESSSRFLRGSDRYPLTAQGDVNTYQVFAELLTHLLSPSGRVGVILPTGIVTDFYTQDFFAELVNSQRLQSVVGFENEAFIFPTCITPSNSVH